MKQREAPPAVRDREVNWSELEVALMMLHFAMQRCALSESYAANCHHLRAGSLSGARLMIII